MIFSMFKMIALGTCLLGSTAMASQESKTPGFVSHQGSDNPFHDYSYQVGRVGSAAAMGAVGLPVVPSMAFAAGAEATGLSSRIGRATQRVSDVSWNNLQNMTRENVRDLGLLNWKTAASAQDRAERMEGASLGLFCSIQ